MSYLERWTCMGCGEHLMVDRKSRERVRFARCAACLGFYKRDPTDTNARRHEAGPTAQDTRLLRSMRISW